MFFKHDRDMHFIISKSNLFTNHLDLFFSHYLRRVNKTLRPPAECFRHLVEFMPDELRLF